MNIGKLLLYAVPLFFCGTAFSQDRLILSGTVTDGNSGEALIGAVVKVGDNYSLANNNGFYSVFVQKGENVVVCSFVGEKEWSESVDIVRDTVLNIKLFPSETLDEALVVETSGRRKITGGIDISLSQIKSTPAVLGEPDVLKVLQKIPGVQPGFEGLAGIYVRGGGADENLFLLDGAPIYNVNHLLGVFSSFTPEAVKKVTFYKSYFPAKFGGRTSSVVDIRSNDGNAYRVKGTVSVGLLCDRFHLEGPIRKGKSTFSLSLRGTHSFILEPILRLCKSPLTYSFYDINAKITRSFGTTDKLSLAFYCGDDLLGYNNSASSSLTYSAKDGQVSKGSRTTENKFGMAWGNKVLSGRWNHKWSPKLLSELSVSASLYRMKEDTYQRIETVRDETGTSVKEYSLQSGIKDVSANLDFELYPFDNNKLEFGGSFIFHNISPDVSSAVSKYAEGDTEAIKNYNNGAKAFSGTESAIYIGDGWNPVKWLSTDVGIRYTYFNTMGESYHSFEPRVCLSFPLSIGLTPYVSYSGMSQYMHLLTTGNISMPTDLWVPITDRIAPLKSRQHAIGLDFSKSGWKVSLEAYYKGIDNVVEYKDGKTPFDSQEGWEQNVEVGRGDSKGVEVQVDKSFKKLTCTLSYTLSKSTRVFENGTINNGKPFPFTYDRRHKLNVFLRYDFTSDIDAELSWDYMSGSMMTASWRNTLLIDPDGYVYHPCYFSGRNNYRLPGSHRLDVSANFRKQKKHGVRTWSVGVYNLYGAKNPNWVVVDYQTCTDPKTGEEYNKNCLRSATFLMFLPSVSFTFDF